MKKLCRACKSSKRIFTLKLGKLPISNALIKNVENKSNKYPLNLFICKNCYLGQLEDFVTKHKIFNSKYRYFSSYSKYWVNHSRKLINKIEKKFDIKKKKPLVAELASNDGYLLQHLMKKNIKCYGVEPSSSVAKISQQKGIKTFIKFFNEKTAIQLKKKKLCADIIIALNVVGHVPDIVSFIKGVNILLKTDGVLIIEIPYFLNLIKKKQFDTIYHEHFSYFSVISMNNILKKNKLHIFDIEYIDTHGGSVRYYVSKENSKHEKNLEVLKICRGEKLFLNNKKNYLSFLTELRNVKLNIKNFFSKLKKKKKLVVGYGAAAKTTILTNLCNIKKGDIAYVVDRNKFKQNYIIPGSMLKIRPESYLRKNKPNSIIIFVWNLAKEIKKQLFYTKKWKADIYTLYPKIKRISK